MDNNETTVENLNLVGGSLCLDFANTVSWGGGLNSNDYISGLSDLVVWSQHAGMLTAADTERTLAKASELEGEGERVFKRSVRLKKTIFDIFFSIAEKKAPKEDDLSTLNSFLSEAMEKLRIGRMDGGYAMEFDKNEDSFDWLLYPIIRSAGELLVSDQLGRIKKCGDSECGWLFVDVSKNKSRRWCDMKDCGNRAKANRFYQRKKNPKKEAKR